MCQACGQVPKVMVRSGQVKMGAGEKVRVMVLSGPAMNLGERSCRRDDLTLTLPYVRLHQPRPLPQRDLTKLVGDAFRLDSAGQRLIQLGVRHLFELVKISGQ